MTAIETPTASLDLSVLVGDWRNTNGHGRIARLVLRIGDAGQMSVQAWGNNTEETNDWGAVPAPTFAFTFDSKEAGAFSAVFDLGYEEVHLQANVKQGVLVVASFNRFTDRSGRSNYFDREFFHRIAAV
jgi:hypothetical protein